MGFIGCISWEKILMQHRDTNFCTSSPRFAPSFVRQPNGPECTQIVRNAPKRQFTVQWGGDRVRSLRKIPMRLRGTNFCTSSARFAPRFVRLNGPECTQIVRNAPKRQFRVQLGGSGTFVAKMHPNSTKRTKTSF